MLNKLLLCRKMTSAIRPLWTNAYRLAQQNNLLTFCTICTSFDSGWKCKPWVNMVYEYRASKQYSDRYRMLLSGFSASTCIKKVILYSEVTEHSTVCFLREDEVKDYYHAMVTLIHIHSYSSS